MNTLATSKDELTESASQLSATWIIAKEVWNDSARQDFEKEYWAEFETTTADSIDRLQELIDALAQAEREIP